MAVAATSLPNSFSLSFFPISFPFFFWLFVGSEKWKFQASTTPLFVLFRRAGSELLRLLRLPSHRGREGQTLAHRHSIIILFQSSSSGRLLLLTCTPDPSNPSGLSCRLTVDFLIRLLLLWRPSDSSTAHRFRTAGASIPEFWKKILCFFPYPIHFWHYFCFHFLCFL